RTHIEDMSAKEPAPPAGTTAAAPSYQRQPPGSAQEGAERSDAPSSGAEASPSSAAPAETVNGDLIALEFGIHKSLRYHAKRRAFFDGFHRIATAITVIAASAVFFALIG